MELGQASPKVGAVWESIDGKCSDLRAPGILPGTERSAVENLSWARIKASLSE